MSGHKKKKKQEPGIDIRSLQQAVSGAVSSALSQFEASTSTGETSTKASDCGSEAEEGDDLNDFVEGCLPKRKKLKVKKTLR